MADQSGWWQTEKNDEVATSPKLWRPLDRAFGGFDLDPAAGVEPTPIAEDRYTKDDDGLTSPWYGTVWLNPPFSEKDPWYRRLVSHYQDDRIDAAAAVSTVDPSANWFHTHFSTADMICYLDGRNWYIGHGDSPSFSTQIGLWNPTPEVVEVCHGLGTIVRPVADPGDVDQVSLDQF